MRALVTFILSFISIIINAQSVKPIMWANVLHSKHDINSTYFLSPDKAKEGYYETIEILEIDNTLVLRYEQGKANENGFIEPNSVHSIMFKISNLTYEWINTFNQEEGILFTGICSHKKLEYDLPFTMKFVGPDFDVLTIGHNVKTLGEVRNYNIERLFDFGIDKDVENKKSPSPQTTNKKKVIKKHKPKLIK